MKRILTLLAILSFWIIPSVTQRCTVRNWTPAANETNPESLNRPNGTPLGFRQLMLPATMYDIPPPCVRVFYGNPISNNYIFVAVESHENPPDKTCVRIRSESGDKCNGTGPVFFCMNVGSRPDGFVDVLFFCNPSCNQSSNSSIFYKVEYESFGIRNDSWCNNRDMRLPSSLAELPTSTMATTSPAEPPTSTMATTSPAEASTMSLAILTILILTILTAYLVVC